MWLYFAMRALILALTGHLTTSPGLCAWLLVLGLAAVLDKRYAVRDSIAHDLRDWADSCPTLPVPVLHLFIVPIAVAPHPDQLELSRQESTVHIKYDQTNDAHVEAQVETLDPVPGSADEPNVLQDDVLATEAQAVYAAWSSSSIEHTASRRSSDGHNGREESSDTRETTPDDPPENQSNSHLDSAADAASHVVNAAVRNDVSSTVQIHDLEDNVQGPIDEVTPATPAQRHIEPVIATDDIEEVVEGSAGQPTSATPAQRHIAPAIVTDDIQEVGEGSAGQPTSTTPAVEVEEGKYTPQGLAGEPSSASPAQPSMPPVRRTSSTTSHDSSLDVDEATGLVVFDDQNAITIKKLGEGSFGKVNLIAIEGTSERYAVKEAFDNNNNNSLLKEAQLQSELTSQNIVRFMGIIRDPGSLKMVLEYCEGGNLFEWWNS